MPDPQFKIQISTPANTSGLEKTTKELKDASVAATQAGVRIDDISDKVGKRLAPAVIATNLALRGMGWVLRIVSVAFGDVGKEVNRLGDNLGKMAARGNLAADALNTALSTVNEFIETSQVSFDNLAKNVGRAEDKFEDATAAARAFAEAQKEVKTEAESAAESIDRQVAALQNQADQTVATLEAQKEQEKARAEVEESDPVKRARRLAGIDASYDGAILNAKIAAGGQQAKLLQTAIDVNKRRAVDAQEDIPDAAVVAKLVEEARAALAQIDSAKVANREAFLDMEALTAVREGRSSGDQFARSLRLEAEAGSKDAAEARAALTLQSTRQGLSDANQSARTALSVLPGTPAQLFAPGGVEAFISDRQAIANEVLSTSAKANVGLQVRLDEVNARTESTQQIGRIGQRTAQFRAGAAIEQARDRGGDEFGALLGEVRGQLKSNNATVIRMLREILADGKVTERELDALRPALKRLQSSE